MAQIVENLTIIALNIFPLLLYHFIQTWAALKCFTDANILEVNRGGGDVNLSY